MLSLALDSGEIKRIFPRSADFEFHQAGLRRRHYHRQLDGWRIRRQILQHRQNEPVREVRRELKPLSLCLLFAVIVGVLDGALSRGGLDADFHCTREGRTFLHQVIADDPEVAALRKNDSFLLSRTILEAE